MLNFQSPKNLLRVGAHLSVSGGLTQAVAEAKAIGANALQLFWTSPRSWQLVERSTAETEAFKQLLKEAAIWPLVIHLSYLLNLASGNLRIREMAVKVINHSLRTAKAVNADYVVLHLGSHLGAGVQLGLKRVIESLELVLQAAPALAPKILLENTAATKNAVGHRLENIGFIIKSLGSDSRLGFCLDTCHAYVSGYDLASKAGLKQTLAAISQCIGLERWFLTHANDSKGSLNSGRDRHEHIGKGYIGKSGWQLLMAEPEFRKRPLIIETPKAAGMDGQNIKVLKELASGLDT